MNIKEKIVDEELAGLGIEFGALHNPVPYNASTSKILYADRLTREDAINNFPELEDTASKIIETDIIFDLDRDSMSVLKGKNPDFIVANHVIEHLVNPIRFLKEVSDLLPDNGKMLLTVPDKNFTHDINRNLTRYRHLVFEYLVGTRRLANHHIRDYLKNKLPVDNVHPKTVEYFNKNGLPLSYYSGNKIPLNIVSRRKLYNYHRQRSIHVHVWDRDSFTHFIRLANRHFKLGFDVSDRSSDESPGEAIYLLQKRAN